MQTSHLILNPGVQQQLSQIINYRVSINPQLVFDLYQQQWMELYQLRNPTTRLSLFERATAFDNHHDGQDLILAGAWVYYPWSGRLLHILAENDFIEVRTSRNQLKITKEEQAILRTKTIGIVGLSVGSAIATTIAQERGAGYLKLADFDTLELSNLNRIKAGLHMSGLNKAVITAQEIAEIDPYLQVEVFSEGLTAENIESFFGGETALDLVVEECDDLIVKQLVRLQARLQRIPVLMETNDRGMLDIERFDLAPDTKLLHGLMPEDPAALQSLAPAARMAMVWQMINGDLISSRLRDSFAEIGKSLTTWPQLASSVVIGGGVVAEVSRKILLGDGIRAGRYYFDIDTILKQSEPMPYLIQDQFALQV